MPHLLNTRLDILILHTLDEGTPINMKVYQFPVTPRPAKRYIAVFAHYDAAGLVEDYVIHYLKCLKEVVTKIVFVSDAELLPEECDKLKGLVDIQIIGRHHEYDFGSYKRGIEASRIYDDETDAIILCNDSCYGPLTSLVGLFSKMEESDVDFWGLTVNQDGYPSHLQSYFLVFNRKIISSDVFKSFFKKVESQERKADIIEKYEIGLTKQFLDAGFKMDSLVRKTYRYNPTARVDTLKELFDSGHPFIKVAIVKCFPKIRRLIFSGKQQLMSPALYAIIQKHSQRIGQWRFHSFSLRFVKLVNTDDYLEFYFLRYKVFQIKYPMKNQRASDHGVKQ